MTEFKDNMVVICDVDGCLTNGGFYSTKDGKYLKKFGADDWDCIKELQKYMKVQFITADKKGFEIVRKRLEDEMGFDLDIVTHTPKERWDWIVSKFPDFMIIVIGDGVYDWYSLQNCDYGITTVAALKHVKECADFVIYRDSGDRFVAEACLKILEKYCDVDIK